MKLYVTIIASLALVACATKGKGQSENNEPTPLPAQVNQFNDLLAMKPESVGSTILIGRQLIVAYNDEGRKVRRKRMYLNLGLVAASTFVTGASALQAHPDTILIGALTGQTLTQLDPILIPGGVETWTSAVSKMTCTISAASGSQNAEVLTAYNSLVSLEKAKKQTSDTQAAVKRYENLKTVIMSKYTTIFGGYIQSSTSAPIDNAQFQNVLNAAKQKSSAEIEAADTKTSKQDESDNTKPEKESTNTESDSKEELNSLITGLIGKDTNDELVQTLNVAVDTIEANINACG